MISKRLPFRNRHGNYSFARGSSHTVSPGAISQVASERQSTMGTIVQRLLVWAGLAAGGGAGSTQQQPSARPCELSNNTALPFCDTKLPVSSRVADLVKRLTVPERFSMLTADGAPIPRLGIAQIRWGTECLHGVDVSDYIDTPGTIPVRGGGPAGGATIFPQPLTTAASFDKLLLGQIGEAIGTEARALNGDGGTLLHNFP